jgi:hypothetical protein
VPPPYDRFEGMSMFDDKGEVKRLIERLVQERDPDVAIERMRKMDFSYIFTLSKKSRSREFEISRSEIDASWDWRNGNIDEAIQKKVKNTIKEF